MTGREAAINNTKHPGVRRVAFWCCQQSRQTPVSLRYDASPVEPRKVAGERDGKGGNEKTHETKKCIISKIGNPF